MTEERKKVFKLYLVEYCPYFDSVVSLAKGLKVSRMTIHRYFNNDDLLRKTVESFMGKKINQPQPVIQPFENYFLAAQESGEVNMTIPEATNKVRKARQRNKFVEKQVKVKVVSGQEAAANDEKLILGSQIIRLYESGVRLSDACTACQVPEEKFWAWLNADSPMYSQTLQVLWDVAKKSKFQRLDFSLVELSRQGLEKKLQDQEYTETTRIGTIKKNEKGIDEVHPKMVKQVTKVKLAEMSAIRLVAENLDPSFKEESKKAVESEEELKFISDEELQRRLAEARAKLLSNDDQQFT